jgi:hypothetical protein
MLVQDMAFRNKRTSDWAEGSWTICNHAIKYQRLARPKFRLRTEEEIAAAIVIYFSSSTYITTFAIYLFSNLFSVLRLSFTSLIRMSPLIRIIDDTAFYESTYSASVVWWSELLVTDPEVRVLFPALPDFLRSCGSGTVSTQPREYNWGATWKKK